MKRERAREAVKKGGREERREEESKMKMRELTIIRLDRKSVV